MSPEDALQDGKDAAPPGGVTLPQGRPAPPEPLPRGQHDLSPEYVARHQRTRILDATTHVLAERGYGPATIGDIVARAHVSRRTFYDHFESKDHCVLATFDAAVACIADAVRDAFAARERWDEAMAAALSELMRVLVEHPDTARTVFLEVRSAGAPTEKPMAAGRAMCVDGLCCALALRPDAGPLADLPVELGVAGVLGVVRDRLAAGDPAALQRELPAIARALLAPLTGSEAAGKVAALIAAALDGRTAHAI